jgi:hypothetical protein
MTGPRDERVSMIAIGTYEILKFLHVLLAIVAVGFNASYGV